MPTPEDFDPEHHPIYWPAILMVFAVQMILLIAVSVAVVKHSSLPTTTSKGVEVMAVKK
jgi:hypothetical protein